MANVQIISKASETMLDKTKISIGIAPIGWTNDDLPELGGDIPFDQCIREMAEAGFEGCEVGGKFPKDPAILRAALKPLQLKIAAQWFSAFLTTAADTAATLARFDGHLAFLSSVGAPIAVVSDQTRGIQQNLSLPILEERPRLEEPEWHSMADGLNQMGDMAAAYGLKIAFHHHMGTVVQTREDIDRLMELTDPSKVFLLADTGHMAFAGGDPAQLLRDYRSRIAHIHLKDLRSNILDRVQAEGLSFLDAVKQGVFTVPGDGYLDFQTIFKALGEMDYSGWLIVEAEQDPKIANPLKYATLARTTIRNLGGI